MASEAELRAADELAALSEELGLCGDGEGPQPQYMDNPRACGAPRVTQWGYLPCGCENDGFGRHAAYKR